MSSTMNKKDIVENPSGFKAVNAFIFAGSFSLGVMRAGFDLKEVLEISDQQLSQNAFYFKKNVEDVPVVLPAVWENDSYLDSLGKQDIDLMCCNCPCSSLSQINRHASVDGKNNVHFYRLFSIFKHVKPKVFVIENAPTLIKLGYPILKDMVRELSPLYRFTAVRDNAGNHEVPMIRQRTLVFGWRRDAFTRIPVIRQDAHRQCTVQDTFADILSSTVDDFKSHSSDEISDLYKYAIPDNALMKSLAIRWRADAEVASILEKRLSGTRYLKEIKRIAGKMASNASFWDKTPHKLSLGKPFPSFTSVSEYLHPLQDRALNLLELKRIMNYPDWYDFTDEKHECKIPVIQAMAQGVPANFGKYAAMQARNALEHKLATAGDESAVMSFQHHSKHMMSTFTVDEVMSASVLELKKDSQHALEV